MSDTAGDKNAQRDKRGCIVTIESLRTGERRTYHVAGLRRVGAQRVADLCDELGTEWRIASYSTPATILSDLDGTRFADSVRRGGMAEVPEANIFGKLGRRALVHPRLTHYTERGERSR